jgi:Family of unknown function (DUF6235)
MAEPTGPAGRRPPTPLRVTSGFDLLERWSEQATQAEKNIVHQVLFAVVDRSVFRRYAIVDDVTKTMEFFVLSRCDLTVKIRLHDFGTCGITYVGPTCAAPGLDQAAPEASAPGSQPRPDASRTENENEKKKGAPHRI